MSETTEQWCVFSDDPEDGIVLISEDLADVEEMAPLVLDAGIARRVVRTSEWVRHERCSGCGSVLNGELCCDGRRAEVEAGEAVLASLEPPASELLVCTCTPTMRGTGRRCEGCDADDLARPDPPAPVIGYWERDFFRDVLGDITSSYIADPDDRAEMIAAVMESLDEAPLQVWSPAPVSPGEATPTRANERVRKAVREIEAQAGGVDDLLQPGAAFALGTLAEAVGAGPGWTADNVADALSGSPVAETPRPEEIDGTTAARWEDRTHTAVGKWLDACGQIDRMAVQLWEALGGDPQGYDQYVDDAGDRDAAWDTMLSGVRISTSSVAEPRTPTESTDATSLGVSAPGNPQADGPTGGPWTRHGHLIDGVTVSGPGRPPVARCGGPALCGKCAADADRARMAATLAAEGADEPAAPSECTRACSEMHRFEPGCALASPTVEGTTPTATTCDAHRVDPTAVLIGCRCNDASPPSRPLSDLADAIHAAVPAHPGVARPADGAALIAAERARQTAVEGWTPEHDDEHAAEQLASAAACYALPSNSRRYVGHASAPWYWPWATSWWKPCPDDRVRELVKAGALIAAEIDRLSRVRALLTGGDPT